MIKKFINLFIIFSVFNTNLICVAEQTDFLTKTNVKEIKTFTSEKVFIVENSNKKQGILDNKGNELIKPVYKLVLYRGNYLFEA